MTFAEAFPDWRERALAWLAAIDPKSHEPRYLITREEAAGTVGGEAFELLAAEVDAEGAALAGMAGLTLCHDLRPAIERTIGWAGGGFAAVFDLGPLRTLIDLEGTAIHEYCHDAELRGGFVARHPGANYEALLADVAKAPPLVDAPRPRPGPWVWHSPAWVRLCVHAVWRAQRAGWRGDLLDVADTTLFGYSAPAAWIEALGDEPAQWAGQPLRSIMAVPERPEFTRFAGAELAAAKERYDFIGRHKRHEPY